MATASLTCVNPTQRIDGSSLQPSDIMSVDIFDDTGGGPQNIGSSPGAGTTFTTGALAVGAHSFTVIVNDTQGNKSAPSNAAAVTVPQPTVAAPNPATALTATLNP